jgi:hypothetical protein
MATRKTVFEKTWNRKEKDANGLPSNVKNKFIGKRYFLAALNWAVENEYEMNPVYEEIEALEE